MRTLTVLELRVDFKYDLEDVRQRALPRIIQAISRWAKPARHGRATCSFLVVTNEDLAQFSGRVGPPLEKIDGVDYYCVHFAPQGAISSNGTLDPYIHWLGVAWKIAGEGRQSQHMRHPERRGTAVRRI